MSAKVKKYGKILAVLLTVLVTITLAGIGATWTKAQVVTESQKVTSPESIDMEAPSTIEKESPSNDTKKHVVREVLEKRDANHRHWEVVKQIEIIDPGYQKSYY